MPKEDKEEVETTESEAPAPDGVLVLCEPDNNGEIILKVQAVGKTSVIEVPTLLQLAAKQVREQLGI